MRKVILAAFAASTLAVTGFTAATTATAMGKVKCDVSGFPTVAVGNYDPIVNHQQVGDKFKPSMHTHQFFGNTSWFGLANPNTASLTDLVDKPNNCRKVLGAATSLDSAGYWVPTLEYRKPPPGIEKVIPSNQFTAYYRAAQGSSYGPAATIPHGARLVSEPGRYNWTCGQNSGPRSTPVSSIPDCRGLSGKPGLTLTLHIDFQECYNGAPIVHPVNEVGDTRDNGKFAYAVKGKCPASHPIGVAQLRETIQYKFVGDPATVSLSSDVMAGVTNGSTAHGDFLNAWNEQGLADFIRTCVNQAPGFPYSTSRCDP